MKLISIEEMNVLVSYNTGIPVNGHDTFCLGEADTRLRILTDDERIVTRFLIGGYEALAESTLEEIVENVDSVSVITYQEVSKDNIKQWVEGELANGNCQFDAACEVVSLLAKYRFWDRTMSSYVHSAFEDSEV